MSHCGSAVNINQVSMQVQKGARNREQEIPIQQRRPQKWPVPRSTKFLICLYFSDSNHHLTNFGKGMMLEDQSKVTRDTHPVLQGETYASIHKHQKVEGQVTLPGIRAKRRLITNSKIAHSKHISLILFQAGFVVCTRLRRKQTGKKFYRKISNAYAHANDRLLPRILKCLCVHQPKLQVKQT